MIRDPRLGVAARWLVRLLAWQDCLLCRGHSRGALLCGFCRRALPRCGARLDRGRLARACQLDWLAVRHDFAEPLRSLVTRFKYHGELALGPVLAGLLARPPAAAGPPSRASLQRGRMLVIAVPSDPVRLRQRGYDHTALLAAAYARRHGLARTRAWRTRPAPAQAGLGRQRRAANLKDAFDVDPSVRGRQVLLLDDVLTTGATLRELATTCRKRGAAWVGAVVLARTPGRGELVAES